MKPASFDYCRPTTLAEAGAMLTPGARLIAGGQSLGPMLNFRLARPERLVAIGGLSELWRVQTTQQVLVLGAGLTHAAISDGRTPDLGDRWLARIAENIAYRAVRNRGTIGGSLAHADPAADWLITLTALGGSVLTWRSGGPGRAIPLERFATGAFRTALEPGEIVQAVRLPHPSAAARWGYVKACRKPGEFAHAMAAFLDDPQRGVRRAAIGALGGPPVVLEGDRARPDAVASALAASGMDAVGRHMQAVALERAIGQAGGP
jgi:carbon-monoxide dehydrogenase medium subunit